MGGYRSTMMNEVEQLSHLLLVSRSMLTLQIELSESGTG
jgi:hypothetical protein